MPNEVWRKEGLEGWCRTPCFRELNDINYTNGAGCNPEQPPALNDYPAYGLHLSDLDPGESFANARPGDSDVYYLGAHFYTADVGLQWIFLGCVYGVVLRAEQQWRDKRAGGAVPCEDQEARTYAGCHGQRGGGS